jgi:serine/threonine protein kinase
MSHPSVTFKKGETVEGYRVLQELGRGAASIIYLVQDPKSKEIWALKHVAREDAKDTRFLDQADSEAEVARKLSHPAIRRIERVIKKTQRLIQLKELFVVMEFVDGESLDQQPPRTFEEAVSVFNQVAEAMHYMHAQGFVHADMKPNNIVVTADGHAKIIDLGQSCPVNAIKERIQGTPDYIAPEQVHRRPITAKTDVYNLGATMYFVFTGKKVPTALATGDSLVSRLDDNLMERPKPARDLNKKIDQRLNDLIMQCVEIDPDKRPTDMKAVADRLNLILGVLRAKNSTEPPVDEGTASFQVG